MKFSHETGGWVEDRETQGYYEVKTWWRSVDDFVAWTKSPAFGEAHPTGHQRRCLLGPNQLEIHEVFFETISETRRSRQVRWNTPRAETTLTSSSEGVTTPEAGPASRRTLHLWA